MQYNKSGLNVNLTPLEVLELDETYFTTHAVCLQKPLNTLASSPVLFERLLRRVSVEGLKAVLKLLSERRLYIDDVIFTLPKEKRLASLAFGYQQGSKDFSKEELCEAFFKHNSSLYLIPQPWSTELLDEGISREQLVSTRYDVSVLSRERLLRLAKYDSMLGHVLPKDFEDKEVICEILKHTGNLEVMSKFVMKLGLEQKEELRGTGTKDYVLGWYTPQELHTVVLGNPAILWKLSTHSMGNLRCDTWKELLRMDNELTSNMAARHGLDIKRVTGHAGLDL